MKLVYSYAKQLIEKVKCLHLEDRHHTEHTRSIQNDLDTIQNEEELQKYIQDNYLNFSFNNLSAKRVLEELIEDIIPTKDEIQNINYYNIEDCHVIGKEYHLKHTDNLYESWFANKDVTSISTMIDVITGINLVNARMDDSKIFKKARLMNEIKSRFPTKHSFSKEEPTYEELRKEIIMLASYRFWVNQCVFEKQKHLSIEDSVDEYMIEINDVLMDANLPELYLGNPYDWMFIYCIRQTANEYDPLDAFRSIIGDAFYTD